MVLTAGPKATCSPNRHSTTVVGSITRSSVFMDRQWLYSLMVKRWPTFITNKFNLQNNTVISLCLRSVGR